jgi:hypothetical protein
MGWAESPRRHPDADEKSKAFLAHFRTLLKIECGCTVSLPSGSTFYLCPDCQLDKIRIMYRALTCDDQEEAADQPPFSGMSRRKVTPPHLLASFPKTIVAQTEGEIATTHPLRDRCFLHEENAIPPRRQ